MRREVHNVIAITGEDWHTAQTQPDSEFHLLPSVAMQLAFFNSVKSDYKQLPQYVHLLAIISQHPRCETKLKTSLGGALILRENLSYTLLVRLAYMLSFDTVGRSNFWRMIILGQPNVITDKN